MPVPKSVTVAKPRISIGFPWYSGAIDRKSRARANTSTVTGVGVTDLAPGSSPPSTSRNCSKRRATSANSAADTSPSSVKFDDRMRVHFPAASTAGAAASHQPITTAVR